MSGNGHLYRVTLLLVAVSSALMQFALDGRQPGSGLVLLGVSLVCAFVLNRVTRAGAAGVWNPTAVGGVVALALLPVVWDLAARLLWSMGAPYEVQLACVLRNSMLALAATPRLPRATAHAALGSFFLVVFGYLWSSGAWAIGLLVAYALIGTWWLLAAYWDRLGGKFADSSESAMPLRPASAAVLALAATAALLLPLTRYSATTTALAGFFPSSGGTQWNDPFAHGGVGDGDQLVGGKDQASSFGPVDTELFLESKMPSLYDAFNEFSEATPIKRKKARRAIPLAPLQAMENHQKTGVTQRASKEFSAVRQTTPRNRNREDRLSAALLMVRGRTPLHLAMETYDRWDGRSLLAAEGQKPIGLRLRDADKAGRRWLTLSRFHPADAFTERGASQVRFLNLASERVPTPAGVTSVTMTALHAASMFGFAADGSLTMGSQRVPQLTIFEFRSALRDRLSAPRLAKGVSPEGSGAIAALAAEWTESVPPGWGQVDAIVRRLRERCTLDREAMVPEDADDAVEHFLFESRRGPDYLFATSASLLLRSLGYDTRVRSGFYASPHRYERMSGLTQVLAEDAHFWTEVRTQNGRRVTKEGDALRGVWITVEPTPGYDMLYAPESLPAWLMRQAAACLAALAANPGLTLAGAALAGLVFSLRRLVLDGLLIGWWSVRARTTGVTGLTRTTLRLLEWRAWAYRQSRPAGASLGRWEAIRSQSDFVSLAGWALYGAGSPAPIGHAPAREICRKAIRTSLRASPRRAPTPPSSESSNATETTA